MINNYRKYKSIISQPDPIQAWLDTLAGYYKGTDEFGLDPNLFLFKNSTIALSRIYDKIIEDLGKDIAYLIDKLELNILESDRVEILIYYKQKIASVKVNK
jgi:hypothetical protein